MALARVILPDNVFEKPPEGGRYFEPPPPLEFIPSGCRLLDCVLGGGWPLSRISNIVGDKSTCKTLLAIEATASFMRKYPNAMPKYREAEAAFDQGYAASIGMPVDKIDFGLDRDVNTVEDFYADLNDYTKELNGEPGLYILDSLDALSTESELKRDFNEGSYNMEKAKQMGQIFRRLVRELRRTNTHLMIISQERDNIGVTFGKKSTRSGGRALDFFASQCLWLAKVGTNEQTIGKIKRPISLDIRAKAEKNKVSIALRQCDFTFRFNFGIDELQSYIDWLEDVGRLELVLGGRGKVAFKNQIEKLTDAEYWDKVREIGDICVAEWEKIEKEFAPPRKRVADTAEAPVNSVEPAAAQEDEQA
jgi:recombination protein RecA